MLCAVYMYALFNGAVSGLYYIASNYLMVVINEPDNMRPRKPTNNVRQRSQCPSRGSIRVRLKYEPEKLMFGPTLLRV